MKRLVSSRGFKIFLGACVLILPGGAILMIAATLFNKSNRATKEPNTNATEAT